jgi:hypothetical protein
VLPVEPELLLFPELHPMVMPVASSRMALRNKPVRYFRERRGRNASNSNAHAISAGGLGRSGISPLALAVVVETVRVAVGDVVPLTVT